MEEAIILTDACAVGCNEEFGAALSAPGEAARKPEDLEAQENNTADAGHAVPDVWQDGTAAEAAELLFGSEDAATQAKGAEQAPDTQAALAEKAAADLERFARAHPTVKLETLLPELTAELAQTQDLETAYGRYELRRARQTCAALERELDSLRRTLEAERQNASNLRRSPGSQRSAGAPAGADPFLEALFGES